MSSRIRFFNEGNQFSIKKKKMIRKWLNSVFIEEKQGIENVNIILCNDDYLLELNRRYLNHESLTDILTFSYDNKVNKVLGDIFISIERVKENAKKFRQELYIELCRVFVHGILHLLGYNDKKRKEKQEMKLKEDYYLKKFMIEMGRKQINVEG